MIPRKRASQGSTIRSVRQERSLLRIVVAVLLLAQAYTFTSLRECTSHRVSCPTCQACPAHPESACPTCQACPAHPESAAHPEAQMTQQVLQGHRDFLQIAQETRTDKCKVNGHFYHTMYQKWLGGFSTDDAPPFQLLEIGYYKGQGFDAFSSFLPRAEAHSMEISCLPLADVGHYTKGSGVWPKEWGNFASINPKYQELRAANRLHCGDSSDIKFMDQVWRKHLQRPDAPPLKVVIDDGAHQSDQMAASLFYWFPRIEPGGIFVMEDIQPQKECEVFRTQLLPQLLKDVHFCGPVGGNTANKGVTDVERFPTLRPLLKGIHCELHICIFQRNDLPALPDLSLELSTPPPHALNLNPGIEGPGPLW